MLWNLITFNSFLNLDLIRRSVIRPELWRKWVRRLILKCIQPVYFPISTHFLEGTVIRNSEFNSEIVGEVVRPNLTRFLGLIRVGPSRSKNRLNWVGLISKFGIKPNIYYFKIQLNPFWTRFLIELGPHGTKLGQLGSGWLGSFGPTTECNTLEIANPFLRRLYEKCSKNQVSITFSLGPPTYWKKFW